MENSEFYCKIQLSTTDNLVDGLDISVHKYPKDQEVENRVFNTVISFKNPNAAQLIEKAIGEIISKAFLAGCEWELKYLTQSEAEMDAGMDEFYKEEAIKQEKAISEAAAEGIDAEEFRKIAWAYGRNAELLTNETYASKVELVKTILSKVGFCDYEIKLGMFGTE